jgi:hypothetical protein
MPNLETGHSLQARGGASFVVFTDRDAGADLSEGIDTRTAQNQSHIHTKLSRNPPVPIPGGFVSTVNLKKPNLSQSASQRGNIGYDSAGRD